MKGTSITPLDRILASICTNCPVGRMARRSPSGLAHWLVRRVESTSCPFCRAYERVYARIAFEKTPSWNQQKYESVGLSVGLRPGIQASANWTVRNIADNSGTHRPYDIQQIVRGYQAGIL